MRILIDTDAYIAIYNKSDVHHKRAVEILGKLDSSASYFTTWDVIDETTTKLSYYLTKAAAKKFLEDTLKSEIVIIYPDEEILYGVSKLLLSIKTKHVSFTDCSNMIVYGKFDIDHIFSFDKIYTKCGYKTLQSYS